MEQNSVSRCVAVAAHGRRCRQSPFRGSPYCWHHTQSRKIPPPSRPLTRPPVTRPPVAARAGRPPLAAIEVAAEPAVIAAAPAVDAARLVRLLGAQAAPLMAFLEGWGDGGLHLERTAGVLSASLVAAAPPRRAAGEISAR